MASLHSAAVTLGRAGGKASARARRNKSLLRKAKVYRFGTRKKRK